MGGGGVGGWRASAMSRNWYRDTNPVPTTHVAGDLVTLARGWLMGCEIMDHWHTAGTNRHLKLSVLHGLRCDQ